MESHTTRTTHYVGTRVKLIEPAQFCRERRARQIRCRARQLLTRTIGWASAAGLVGLVLFACIAPLQLGQLGGGRLLPLSQALRPTPEPAGASPAPVLEQRQGRVVRFRQGNDLARVLIQAGVVRTDAARGAALVAAAVFPDPIAGDTDLIVTTGPPDPHGERRLEGMSLRARLDLAVTVRRGPAGLALAVRPIAIDATPIELGGAVGFDLVRSLANAQTPPADIVAVGAALQQHLGSGTPLLPSDRFELVFEQWRAADGRVATGGLLYAALRRGDRPLIELVRWNRDDRMSAVAANADPDRRSGAALPVSGHLTSAYGMRFHPILGYTRLHAGIDVGASQGSPVVAARAGTVVIAGWHGGHGNYIRLDHGAGLQTGYAHLSRLAVPAGARVRAGEVIGYVGSTGLSTGPHLHYEVFRGGRPVDPLREGLFVGPSEAAPRHAFAAAVASLRSLIKVP